MYKRTKRPPPLSPEVVWEESALAAALVSAAAVGAVVGSLVGSVAVDPEHATIRNRLLKIMTSDFQPIYESLGFDQRLTHFPSNQHATAETGAPINLDYHAES